MSEAIELYIYIYILEGSEERGVFQSSNSRINKKNNNIQLRQLNTGNTKAKRSNIIIEVYLRIPDRIVRKEQ